MKNTDTFIFMGEKMYEFAEMLKERMEAEEAGKIEYVINEFVLLYCPRTRKQK